MAIRDAQNNFIATNVNHPANGDPANGVPVVLDPVNFPSALLIEMLMADFPFVLEDL